MRRDGQDGQGGALQATLQFEGKAERRDLARAISIHLLVRALRIIAVVEIETAAHPVREAASADHAGLRRRAQRVEQQAGQCKRAEMIGADMQRSEEHTSELQSLIRNTYAVFCLKKKK